MPERKKKELVKEREKLLHRKLEGPILEGSLIKDNWQFIFYNDLRGFFNNNKRKKEISTGSFDNLFRMPKNWIEQKQNSLNPCL